MKKIVITILIVLALVSVGGWVARGPYKQWKQQRFLTQAQNFLARGDYRDASFSARETLAINSTNVEACRVMAQIAQAAGSGQAVAWRGRVVELQPEASSNRLALAQTAILFGQLARADKALQGMKEPDRETVDYQLMAAYVATMKNDLADAEAHCVKAVKIDPNHKGAQLNLALLQLPATDQEVAAAARARLEQLSADPGLRRDALRGLVEDALRGGNLERAVNFSRQLEAEKPPLFSDGLMHLSVLKQAHSPEEPAYLMSVEKTAAANPKNLYALVLWFRGHGMPDEGLNWLLSLPEKTRESQATTRLIADCYGDLHQWEKMQSALEGKKWGDAEFLRLAMLARACKEQRQDLKSEAAWHSATSAAYGKLGPLSTLLSLADAWNWPREKEDVAWLIVQKYPGERRVLAMLNDLYASSGNTRGLHKISATRMGFNSGDVVARNNFAAISLLLNLDLEKARDLARENYNQHPEDPVIASTYAYSLHLQGKTGEGLKLLEKFKPEELQKPAVAIYYGVILAANGESEKARDYLEIARCTQLLPEEKLLVATALKSPTPGN